jgi:hypothetical protein
MYTVIQCTYDSLSFAILSGAVGTRQTKANALSGKVLMNNSIIEFFPIVGLKGN